MIVSVHPAALRTTASGSQGVCFLISRSQCQDMSKNDFSAANLNKIDYLNYLQYVSWSDVSTCIGFLTWLVKSPNILDIFFTNSCFKLAAAKTTRRFPGQRSVATLASASFLESTDCRYASAGKKQFDTAGKCQDTISDELIRSLHQAQATPASAIRRDTHKQLQFSYLCDQSKHIHVMCQDMPVVELIE